MLIWNTELEGGGRNTEIQIFHELIHSPIGCSVQYSTDPFSTFVFSQIASVGSAKVREKTFVFFIMIQASFNFFPLSLSS